MFVEKNDLSSLKKYFSSKLPDLSSSEINSIVKQLVVKRLGLDESDYLLSKKMLFSESDLLHFRGVVKRLEKHEPFQHVLGEVEFYGLILKSDARALVPRPETEELVDWVIKDNKGKSNLNVMDLCSGSGCIAFGVKSVLNSSNVSAIEFSPEAISLMEENRALTGLKIDVIEGDVLNKDCYLEIEKSSFDCWISNPPYIPITEREAMHPNVTEYEPSLALFVEDNLPFVFYSQIAQNAMIYLRSGGWLYFEIHESFGQEVVRILEDFYFVNIELRKDLQGRDRMIKAQKLSSPNEDRAGEIRS